MCAVGCEKTKSCKIDELGKESRKADLRIRRVVLGLDEELAEEICPVCVTFTASTVSAVYTHIDGSLIHTSRVERRKIWEKKINLRMEKKCLMVELFAVAPEVGTVEDDEDASGDDRDDSANQNNGFEIMNQRGGGVLKKRCKDALLYKIKEGAEAENQEDDIEEA